jgi:acetoin utilization deacetylase AcuC-like enzyme
MRFGFNETCLEHDPGQRHPENPDRLRAIREGLDRADDVEWVNPPPASMDDAEAVHDANYVAEIRDFIESGGGNWDPDTIATETTWEAALASAGLSKWAAETALTADGGHEVPFALGRPPGHHATADDAMGFCFLNNAAIAAEYVLRSESPERVAIVDWDVHHGNGIQDIFYDREDVYYVSVHENGLYPGTGDITEVGSGEGAGTTLNVPLPPGSGNADYLAVIDELVTPGVIEYDPDLLLVSAGFDAHRHDPISRMHVTTPGYVTLTNRLWSLSRRLDVGLGFVLEGGYGLDTLAEGVTAVHRALEGEEGVEPEASVSDEVVALIEEVRRAHQAAN